MQLHIRSNALALLSFALATITAGGAAWAGQPFVVHEWGVVFLSAHTVPSPLQPSRANNDQLPNFVLRHDEVYEAGPSSAFDKPVLYFYGDEGLAVHVELRTAQGKPLAYWPEPQDYVEEIVKKGATRRQDWYDAFGMIWEGTLHRDAPDDLPAVSAGDSWTEARKVPAMYFKSTPAKLGSERFIFYEATGRTGNAITTELSAMHLTLTNHGQSPSGTILVIISDGRSRHLTLVDSLAPGAKTALDRQKLLSASGEDQQIISACKKQWTEFGMTVPEADAVVATYQKTILATQGFMIVRRMPAADYDATFPLEITPKPDQLVRVGMVYDTLPGCDMRLAWLEPLSKSIEKWGVDLGNDEFSVRTYAADNLAAADDLAKPMLEKLAHSTDPEVQTKAQALLARLALPLAPAPTTQPVKQGETE